MNKNTQRHQASLPIENTSYQRVTNSIARIESEHTSKSDKLKLCERKRTKKRKLLMQIAIVGVFAWGALLLASYIIGKESDTNAQHLSFTAKNILALSELTLTKSISPIVESIEIPSTVSRTREQTQQLLRIRMHNILRNSNVDKPIALNAVRPTTQYHMGLTKGTNVQKDLVAAWEKDYLNESD